MQTVTEGGLADQAGLRRGNRQVQVGNIPLLAGGDHLLSINRTSISDTEQLIGFLDFEMVVGETVQLGIARDGQEITISVTLGELA